MVNFIYHGQVSREHGLPWSSLKTMVKFIDHGQASREQWLTMVNFIYHGQVSREHGLPWSSLKTMVKLAEDMTDHGQTCFVKWHHGTMVAAILDFSSLIM